MLTDMRRVSVPIPEDLDRQILELKKTDKYVRCSYAELVRILLKMALDEQSTACTEV